VKNSNIFKRGFTIIEVVLVLAIAGLIFLMVFIALPTLQRNQRDTQRRSDMDRVAAQVQAYMGNNNGRVPFTGPAANENGAWAAFLRDYLNTPNPFLDPNGESYTITYKGNAAAGTANTAGVGSEALDFNQTIYVYGAATCDGESAVAVANGTRRVAFRLKLEGAGVYCVDNA